MNSKNIKKHLNGKLRDWLKSIDDEEVKKTIQDNVIVTGGAIVSLLTGDTLHDYDVYFRNRESLLKVVNYYVAKWNVNHSDGVKQASIVTGHRDEEGNWVDDGRVKVFIRSKGVAGDEVEPPFSDVPVEHTTEEKEMESNVESETDDSKKYNPVFLTSNAITLSNKIQIVTRFYGEIEEIHKNYDFAHCTCAWSSWDNELYLPVKALECIINKELYYVGSKYPLCSIIRTRKYLERGYHINAGQYVKMAMQLNELNLKDIETLEDQLTGVDTGYFQMMVDSLKARQKEDGSQKIDSTYVIELINKLF